MVIDEAFVFVELTRFCRIEPQATEGEFESSFGQFRW